MKFLLQYLVVFLLSSTHLLAVVDLNNATADQLLKLNGIGKAKSQKIIAYREAKQCFKSIDELAYVEGISEKIILSNRGILELGVCKKILDERTATAKFMDVFVDPINIAFVCIIFILAFLDVKTGKDLKSQIVSVGVLGTFVGIFIGLQGFNPDDIVNSVNEILVGMKTAFFTSIVGMSISTILCVVEKLRSEH